MANTVMITRTGLTAPSEPGGKKAMSYKCFSFSLGPPCISALLVLPQC